MRSGRRGGFTLAEILVVTVLGGLVLMATLQTLISNRRAFTAQAATISGQQTTRMAVEVLFAELREVSPSGGDILAMSGDSVRVRLMRKFSLVCDVDLTVQPKLTVLRDLGSLPLMGGANAFVANDSVFVFADNDKGITSDDVWISADVSAVDTSGVTCPQDGNPAMELTFNGLGVLFAADSVHTGAAVRSFEAYTFGSTLMNGDRYLARRRRGGDMVPIAGPLRDTGGLEFVYRDRYGAATTTAADVAQIEVIVRTGSEVMNSLGRMVSDSVRVWVHTRN